MYMFYENSFYIILILLTNVIWRLIIFNNFCEQYFSNKLVLFIQFLVGMLYKYTTYKHFKHNILQIHTYLITRIYIIWHITNISLKDKISFSYTRY